MTTTAAYKMFSQKVLTYMNASVILIQLSNSIPLMRAFFSTNIPLLKGTGHPIIKNRYLLLPLVLFIHVLLVYHCIVDSVHLLMDKRLMFMTTQEVHVISILSRPPG